MPNIQIIDTDGRVSNFPVNKETIVVGRSEENDLVLPDQSISRNHARITKEKKGYILIDFFTDIVGFTPLSEKMPPREIKRKSSRSHGL